VRLHYRTSSIATDRDGQRRDTDRMMTASNRQANTRPPGSRLLHGLDQLAARPFLALAVVAADSVWVIASAALGFPASLDSVFQTLVAALTLAMVFVIQHTQEEEQQAIQDKLDEIMRALQHDDTGP
jgi:cobalamin biosynthesis protein CobD/CbiB